MSRIKKAKPRKPRNFLAVHAHNRKAGPEKLKKDKRVKNKLQKEAKVWYSDEDLLDAQIKREEEGIRLELELEKDRLADEFD